jgi:DNA-binding beta-propeller fold protein YncE
MVKVRLKIKLQDTNAVIRNNLRKSPDMSCYKTNFGNRIFGCNVILLVLCPLLILAVGTWHWLEGGVFCAPAYGDHFAVEGDICGDKGVNFDDYTMLVQHWLSDCNDPNWCDGCDLDKSGQVDTADLCILADNWLVGQMSDLSVKSINRFPMRIARGDDGKIFVTNSKAGSLFIYDANHNLIGELKDLHKPLGVAVDSYGYIYVGSRGRHDVEVYNRVGEKVDVMGLGIIRMPSDLALDRDGNIYVCDSQNNTVWVFDWSGAITRSIGTAGDGDGQFDFPSALTIAYRKVDGQEIGELYVADQKHCLIHVFDLKGKFLRSFGRKVGSFGGWRGKFVRMQSLAMDNKDRLHVADSYINAVQILDPNDGDYINHYGTFGSGTGELKLPLDVVINDSNEALVTSAENGRIEKIAIPEN